MALLNTPLKGKARADEIIKCGNDAVYFMKHYVSITHADRGLIRFETYPFQDECVAAFQKHRMNIVNKSRQLGLSTVTAAYCLWMAIFQRQKNILVIATKLDTAKNFLTKVRQMFDSLPEWLVLPKVEGEGQKYIKFNNGSKVTAIPTSKDAGRSEALSLLVVDEAAHIEDFDVLWAGLKPTLSTGGSCILISTPLGVGNQFHKLWVGAQTKTNNFNPIELPWTVHPEHDQEWFESESRDMDSRLIAQEFLCNFNSSGNTYIRTEDISRLEQSIREPVDRFPTDPDGWIWKHPVPGRKYIISADVARGDADDFSAFHVLDTVESEVVAEYQGKRPPDRFAELLAEVGSYYNNALVCNEKNAIGSTCSFRLRDLKYPNLYYEKLSRGGLVNTYTPEEVEEEIPGITTTSKTRTPIVATLEAAIRNRVIRIYSSRLVNELKTFIWDGSRAKAQKNYFDDLTMALAIGTYIYEFSRKVEDVNSAELTRAMMAAFGKKSAYYSSIAANMPGNSGFSVSKTTSNSWPEYGMLPSTYAPRNIKLPQGINPEQAMESIGLQNMFSWVLDPPKEKK